MSALELQVGLIGCGTVGSAFCEALAERQAAVEARFGARLRLVEVAVARPRLPRAAAGRARLHGDALALAENSALDIVVEASGAPGAAAWLLAAHERGAAVVTSNKQALAGDASLLELLARHDARLQCEAAVAGGVPVVRALRESLAADEVRSLRGVLNGTTTYVLSRIEEGASLEEGVREAQRAGYAERDPSYDLGGQDAAAKLAILATLAWLEPVGLDRIAVRGLDEGAARAVRDAGRDGRRVRLVAAASQSGRLESSFAPAALEPSDPLAATSGVENVIEVEAAVAGRLGWRGAGAGGRATASALLADTVVAARALVRPAPDDGRGRRHPWGA